MNALDICAFMVVVIFIGYFGSLNPLLTIQVAGILLVVLSVIRLIGYFIRRQVKRREDES